MRRTGWHIIEEAGTLTLARRVPVRFDLGVCRVLPVVNRLRLAHQVRQDMWRVLKRVKGFAPAVQIETRDGQLVVTAGGQVDGPVARAWAEARIADVLDDPVNRARWIRWAG